jgi:hypothetical protein
LRKVANDLLEDGLYHLLETYLKKNQWIEADEETAWIFYQVMIKQGYKNWDELCKELPCKTLQEINQLWLKYSNGLFGISIQRKIYQSLNEDWEETKNRLGWQDGANNAREQGKTAVGYREGSYPISIYTKSVNRVREKEKISANITYIRWEYWFGNFGDGFFMSHFRSILCRVETCKL